ncbi:MAG TPA: hypothetical protein DIT13_08970 [Verrucomicrobiales bacterium]|nr:hypothetical protein [Verrucomicrobiales bacterium]HRJ08684.1 hypothetical protein [Prosthecobacter sp.]
MNALNTPAIEMDLGWNSMPAFGSRTQLSSTDAVAASEFVAGHSGDAPAKPGLTFWSQFATPTSILPAAAGACMG